MGSDYKFREIHPPQKQAVVVSFYIIKPSGLVTEELELRTNVGDTAEDKRSLEETISSVRRALLAAESRILIEVRFIENFSLNSPVGGGRYIFLPADEIRF